MQKLLILAVFFALLTAQTVYAAPVTKTRLACTSCRSRAEGMDVGGARATQWKGTVIGINDGARGFVITESSQLNHIKAFSQWYVQISQATRIIDDLDDKTFDEIDIGYVIEVKGKYDPRLRTIFATSLEVTSVPDEPVTRTK